jgi:P27 family predicted phage terminase small subunit
LRGNPGKRRIGKREPHPQIRNPSCPAWLRPEVKGIWRRTVTVLREMHILTRVDRDALAAYCQTYVRWKAAEQFLEVHGDVYPVRDDKGNVRCMRPYPQVRIAMDMLQVLRSYQQEFGMTPSARTRVEQLPHEIWDHDEERFFGPRPIGPPKVPPL